MGTSLLTTKLYIPPLRPGLVPRPRLIERLNAGSRLGRRLTLISAPAGFGKTTLLGEWVHDRSRSQNRPHVAWLSLDEGDNDPMRFVAYLVAALQTVQADIGAAVLVMLQSPQPPPLDAILTSLINEIAAIPDELVLVLDDYHLIESGPVHDGLAFLLDRLPPQMHLAVATRKDPPLPLARLRVRGEMAEIRARDLRFTDGETTVFLNQAMGLGLTPVEVAALEARTEGWIAGLHLAALSLEGRSDRSAFIQAFTGDDRHVMDYLVNEVLSRQPEGVQRFLLHTAVLDRLCGPLCDAVVDGDSRSGSGQGVLEYLEQANLFVVPLDNRRQWYRYHHMFADLLRHRLRRTVGAGGLVPLHRRASEWYEGNGYVTEAVGHALATREFEVAARLVEQSAVQMFVRSELATILRWVDALPDDLVRARPWLCVYHAWSLRLTGAQAEDVESRLRDAERAIESRARLPSQEHRAGGAPLPESEARRILGHIAAIRAYQALYREEISRVIELADQALERLPEENFVRGLTALALGWALRFDGDLVGASQAFAEARAASMASGDTYAAVAATCRLAYTQVLGGQLHQAVESCREALKMAAGKDDRRLPVAGYAYVYMGGVYREWNDLEAAARYLAEGIELCRQVGYVMDQIVGYATLARVRQAQGDWDGARDACQNAQRLSQRMRGYVYARRWVEDCQVRLWLAQGDPSTAPRQGTSQAKSRESGQGLAAAARWARESGLRVDDEITFLRELEHIILARVLVALGREQPGELYLGAHPEPPGSAQDLPLGRAQPQGSYLVDALDLLARLLEVAERAGWMGKAIEILALQAMALQAQGNTDPALDVLDRALVLAEPEGYVRLFLDEGPPMARLLHRAAARGIARAYVGKLHSAFEFQFSGSKVPGRYATRTNLKPKTDEPETLVEPLSAREMQVLQLIAQGLTNLEIASRLFLALNTVKVHTRNIYGKLGVHSRTQAVARAQDLDLL